MREKKKRQKNLGGDFRRLKNPSFSFHKIKLKKNLKI